MKSYSPKSTSELKVLQPISIKDAASEFSVTEKSIRNLLSKGIITRIKTPSGGVRVSRTELLARCKITPPGEWAVPQVARRVR